MLVIWEPMAASRSAFAGSAGGAISSEAFRSSNWRLVSASTSTSLNLAAATAY
jgi:hypothetical protein